MTDSVNSKETWNQYWLHICDLEEEDIHDYLLSLLSHKSTTIKPRIFMVPSGWIHATFCLFFFLKYQNITVKITFLDMMPWAWNKTWHFLPLGWKLRLVFLTSSGLLLLHSSHHPSRLGAVIPILSASCSPFVFHHLSMIHLLWTRALLGPGCRSVPAGEILTRLWCLLIVPRSNWDARRSPSPWWQWQPVPLVTASHPQKHQRGGERERERERERWVGESWGSSREGRTVPLWFSEKSGYF